MKKTVVNWVALGVGGSFGKHVTDIFHKHKEIHFLSVITRCLWNN